MMNESQQLEAVLTSPFWRSSDMPSCELSVPDGIRIEVAATAGVHWWKVRWPDRSELKCSRPFHPFHSYQEAKTDLRDHLKARLGDLDAAARTEKGLLILRTSNQR